MARFSWGKVIDTFTYDFDGGVMEVTKYHPWKSDGITVLTGKPDECKTEYHCEELRESTDNIGALVISWLAYKHLGLNQHNLVVGISRALCLGKA